MKRVGLGGFQNFDASLFGHAVVDKRVAYMTPSGRMRSATRCPRRPPRPRAAIAGSPGWSESGGPWVKPEQAMKKLVWSGAPPGGPAVHGTLPKPPTTSGPFQNVPVGESLHRPADAIRLYRDVAVVAYRLPASDQAPDDLRPTVTSSSGPVDASLLSDGDLVRSATLPAPPAGERPRSGSVAGPQAIRTATLAMGGAEPAVVGPRPRLRAPGERRRPQLPADRADPAQRRRPEHRAFEPVRARFFRWRSRRRRPSASRWVASRWPLRRRPGS